ncbi:DUF4145 domain-containing protein [Sorangium sp. So ce1389]|uniref:DUF4145 domain-containing protein n=1 Tax=Sorangium sp. So ce1389 TaxID=3133336 RepID=UPI003F637D1E
MLMLDDLTVFNQIVANKITDLFNGGKALGEMHCPRCGDIRRMITWLLYPKSPGDLGKIGASSHILCLLKCVQCDTQCTLLRYDGPSGQAIVTLFSAYGGISTPNTPPAISYYLDQAHKSHSVGANSAAAAMYRAALEQLLYEQGFQRGMLAQKIIELEQAIANKTGPSWSNDLDVDYLKALKDLGNGSIHTNGGDVTKQAAIDSHLLALVQVTFVGLLQIVYEIPQKKAASLAALKAKAALLK